MKYPIFLCFLLLVSVHMSSQKADTTLVRLENELKVAVRDSVKIKAMLQLAGYQLDRDFSQSEQLFLNALQIVESIPAKGHKEEKANIYGQLGVVNRRKGNYPEAIKYYLSSLELFKQIKDTSEEADIYHNMAMVYRYQREHSKAIKNFKKAIQLKKLTTDTLGMGASYNMLGVSYRQFKKLDSALICYQKAKELFEAKDSEENLYRVNGNMAQLYMVNGDFQKSIELNLANLKYYTNVNNKLSTCVTYYNLSDVYKQLKNWEKSLFYINASLKIAEEEGFKERISVAYRRMSYLNAKMENFEDAYQNYRKFNRRSDEIFNLENAKKIQALELNYQFQKEKREVELMAKAESSKKKLYFILLLGAIIAGVVIAFLIRRNYQQRSKLSKTAYENEKRMLDQEIKGKEKDIRRLIADNSMRLAFKEELLDKIKTEVIGAEPESIKQSLNSLTTQLRLQIDTENKLSGLQEKIDYVNQSFNTKLQELYPELTKGEREVCALLRLNLSIKEIMTIRNVSSDSVKSMRRRIRKKMNISQDVELEKFIQELA